MIDNESYYVQTIKWLDQYGLVKGIANLHVYFGQQSGLHILESSLNFDEIYNRWNDISSFYFLIGLIWSFQRDNDDSDIQHYYRKGFTVLSLISFTFISAPSPDTPVYILSYIIIYKFLKLYENWNEGQFLLITLLSMQLIYFKVTAVLIFILPLVLLYKYSSIKKSKVWLKFGVVFTVLFVSKNIIVTGLPFYPVSSWSPLNLEWELPIELIQFYNDITKAQAFGISYSNVNNLSFIHFFGKWFFHPGIEGVFNKILVLSLVASVLFLVFKKGAKVVKWLLFILFVQSLILAFTSPQFRFFLNLLVPALFLILLNLWIPKIKLWNYITTGLIIFGFIIATVTQVNYFFTDNLLMKNRNINKSVFIEPSPKSIYLKEYQVIEKGEFYYNAPTDEHFFYGTYDIPLPATSKKYVGFIERKYQLAPQQIGESIDEGFKYVKVVD